MARLLLRTRVRLRRLSLDLRLAEGEDPAESRALALRAGQLVSTDYRDELAAQVEAIVDAAEHPPRLSAAVPLCHHAILPIRQLLLTLGAELRDREMVRAQGVALSRKLLVDGGSPLYVPREEGALEQAIEEARSRFRYSKTAEQNRPP
jgi:hypothetical protein